jgi:hypothetical protein
LTAFVHYLDCLSTLIPGIDRSLICSWLCTGWFLPKMGITNDASKPEYTHIIFIENTLLGVENRLLFTIQVDINILMNGEVMCHMRPH